MIGTKQILIATTCIEDWGGCEELWARAIPYLINLGYGVSVCKDRINFGHNEYKRLKEAGVTLHQLNPEALQPDTVKSEAALTILLKQEVFCMVVISQGINFDGVGLGYACLRENVPYTLIAQKAVEIMWPYYVDRAAMRNVYLNAEKAFFVSRHNLKLTEEQFGIRLQNAAVISNPVKVNRKIQLYPDTENGFKLACIGRYILIDKGQDILIRIMAQEKWKKRPLKIVLIGSGTDGPALKELAQLLDVTNVEFLDPESDVEKLWLNYHALILPSRFEGTPLVLLEAMALGKTAIVSDAGGNPELITDGETGFVGQPNGIAFEQAMERAWQARENWQAMGAAAFNKLKKAVSGIPEREFADAINELATRNSKLVSVIIPTYNRAHNVEDAILSVLNQTYPSIQLIVADDGSIDGTEALMAKYPQVTYLKLQHAGQAHARNEGLRHARGNYIATLDSDDTWEPDFVKTCLELIDSNNLDFAFANWMQDMGNGKFVDRFGICKVLEETLAGTTDNVVVVENKALRKLYSTGCPSPSSSLLFKRSSLKSNWTSGLRIADDWCLLMDIIFTKECKAAFTRDILWHKKIDGQNIYDGRNQFDNLRDLWIHDFRFLYHRFYKYFTRAEKNKFTGSLASHYLQYSYYQSQYKKNYLLTIKYSVLAFLTNSKTSYYVYAGAERKVKKMLHRFVPAVS